MYILGISCHYHEAAAALIKDGQILAACEEERFTRVKHDNSFPKNAINFCLKVTKATTGQLDYVVFYEKPFLKFERNIVNSLKFFPFSSSFFIESIRNSFLDKLWIKSLICKELRITPEKVLFVPQHLSHAAASYYPSPFTRSAFLTLDAVGEWTTGSIGKILGNKIYPMGEMHYPHSVGLLYSTFTAFLGFEVNDGEYKVMGMTAYGKPKYKDKIKKTFKQNRDGSIRLNLDYFSFHKGLKSMYSNLFIKEFQDLNKFDLAASLQKVTEEIILNMVDILYQKTHEENLVFGGGVALNSVINGKIIKQTKFKNLFIFPAAGDDGGSVGAALYVYYHVLGNKKRYPLKNVFLGPCFSDKDIKEFLKDKKITHQSISKGKIADYISTQLLNGKVIGLYEGEEEFGPRALGHRSILADPRGKEMKDIVNKKIKFREEFRPFAPVVLEEEAQKYFETKDKNLTPFMLGTFPTPKITQKLAPAVVHLDGTSRLQIVPKNYDGKLRKILESFYSKTGVPILLNTSFNLKGEPIVNSPQDALNTFYKSGLDILVLENYVVEK